MKLILILKILTPLRARIWNRIEKPIKQASIYNSRFCIRAARKSSGIKSEPFKAPMKTKKITVVKIRPEKTPPKRRIVRLMSKVKIVRNINIEIIPAVKATKTDSMIPVIIFNALAELITLNAEEPSTFAIL